MLREFPWLETALFIALAVALIVRPQNKTASAATPATPAGFPLPTLNAR
jgi:hypothetical protein